MFTQHQLMKAELLSFGWVVAPRHSLLKPEVPGAWMAHEAMEEGEFYNDMGNGNGPSVFIGHTEKEVVENAWSFLRGMLDDAMYPSAGIDPPGELQGAPIDLRVWAEVCK